MIKELLILLFGIIVFGAYLKAVVNKHKLLRISKYPQSISKSFYLWKDWRGIYFTLAMLGITIPVFVILPEQWDVTNVQRIGYSLLVAGTFLITVVGMFSHFLPSSLTDRSYKIREAVHLIGSYGGIGLSLIAMPLAFSLWWLPFPIIFITTYVLLKLLKINSFIWWVEIIAFILSYTGLITAILTGKL